MTADLSFAPTMVQSPQTARELYAALKAQPARACFGFGARPALVNVDFQQAYTRPDLFPVTAYVTDPLQIEYTNDIAALLRTRGLPVVWTRVGYNATGSDAGVWGTRTNTPDSLQNLRIGSERHQYDPRCDIVADIDLCYTKRMPSAFFETPLASFLIWHKIDTLIVTGGSTSGCVRATAVDSLSHGYRTIVPEECVADKHESNHFANLIDLQLKYADVMPVADVIARLAAS